MLLFTLILISAIICLACLDLRQMSLSYAVIFQLRMPIRFPASSDIPGPSHHNFWPFRVLHRFVHPNFSRSFTGIHSGYVIWHASIPNLMTLSMSASL